MNNTSQSYKQLGIPFFKEVFNLLDRTFKEMEIPYYLLGATAISLELLKDGIKPPRGTKDIDFAIMISSKAEYEQFSAELQKKGFVKVAAPWTFRHPGYDIVVDILPFGKIEENYTENFNQRHTDLHVLGLKEVMSDPAQVEIDDTLVNIPTLPGMIILKLVAWSDRPEERENDLGDILWIISEYYWLMSDFIIDHHSDLLELLEEDGQLSQRLLSARVLGREAAKYLKQSKPLKNRILVVLENNINENYQSTIAKEWAVKLDQSLEYTLSILDGFLMGIKEKL
jgi:predicted nucleotidyltransferase